MVSTVYIQVTDTDGRDLPIMTYSEEFISAFVTAVQESETLITQCKRLVIERRIILGSV